MCSASFPGSRAPSFHRLGSLHRNTFVDGPRVLDPYLRVRRAPWVQLAGQITGVEGYLESAAMGLWAGLNLGFGLQGEPPLLRPRRRPWVLSSAMSAELRGDHSSP